MIPRANHSKRRTASQCKTALCCGFLSFIAVQMLLSAAMDCWNVALRDPLWGRKLAILRSRMAAEPGRPLMAVFGSSRTALGVKLENSLKLDSATDRRPIVFNLAVMGAGPVNELVCLRRLLAEGIRPDRILVEIHPLLLHEERGFGELDVLDVNRLAWSDLSVFARYVYDPDALYRRWLCSRLLPCVSHRVPFQMELAPRWLEAVYRNDQATMARPDRSGWTPHFRESVSPVEFQQCLELSVRGYELAFRQYRITERPDRAVREMLEICKSEHIDAGLFLMPESSGFQAAYTPDIREKLGDYLARISHDYDVRVFDATDAATDASFADGHHLLPSGAEAFASRFERDVLAPFLGQGESARGLAAQTEQRNVHLTARKNAVIETTRQR